ncbi:MAG TPA: trypsin-like peptidase domain-containing protein [Saprospiraceae bacterium]|nr:trypsin-like peptidase domain-containing protein [Saprospiraceae bacterium]HPR01014.1 trypsin-like peptidase domain-containing protein [Saprospiraceae bacterium]HQU53302.1 trypsin-like peptidase domain-containing protein [Saprospiraceae bacterium]HRV84775.1 trypsin-like peptidase domain-containing protein [Saprospiraceae bacterium]
MKTYSFLRTVLYVFLLAAGFLMGVSWQNRSASDDQEDIQPVSGEVTSTPVPTTTGERESTPAAPLLDNEQHTIDLFQHAAPAVVFINTSVYEKDYWSTNVYELPQGSGSGFIWDNQGHIVTNYHVIESAINGGKATVTLADQSVWEAEIIGYAAERDLAVLKIKASPSQLTAINVGASHDLKVGQSVYAIGNPFGLDQTLTTGVISALGREIRAKDGTPIRDVIQSDAAINPGNSGGPLLNSSGQLIGVNTAIYSPSGASAGIGFSIPVDEVRSVIPDLIQYGKIRRPSLGIVPYTSTSYKINGVLILQVAQNSAAEKAGLHGTDRDRFGRIQWGDIIVQIDDDEITNLIEMRSVLEKHNAGDQVKVTVIRNANSGSQKEVTVDLVLDDVN